MAYRRTERVLFRHCDPAGIVFFPRYFEMVNDCVEAFFEAALGWPFAAIHGTAAVPTRAIRSDFLAPSRLGEVLALELRVTGVGATSFSYRMTAASAGEARFTTEATLVHVGASGRPEPWPDAIRAKLRAVKDEDA